MLNLQVRTGEAVTGLSGRLRGSFLFLLVYEAILSSSIILVQEYGAGTSYQLPSLPRLNMHALLSDLRNGAWAASREDCACIKQPLASVSWQWGVIGFFCSQPRPTDNWNPADPNPTLAWHEGARSIVLWSGEHLIFAELLVLRSSGSGHVCWTTVEEDIGVVALTTSHDFHWKLFWKCFYL